ncbi:hypothetical protein TNCV_1773331 [Trichonephila clavipes]|nr:hypothetical protein TNCV_1773331 [Trichonephila clavipes]
MATGSYMTPIYSRSQSSSAAFNSARSSRSKPGFVDSGVRYTPGGHCLGLRRHKRRFFSSFPCSKRHHFAANDFFLDAMLGWSSQQTGSFRSNDCCLRTPKTHPQFPSCKS